jgi:hypothetical protein
VVSVKIVGNLLAVEPHDSCAGTYAQWDEVAASWLHLAVDTYAGPVVIRYGRPWPMPLEKHRKELRRCETKRIILAQGLGFEPITPYGPEPERQFLEHHQATRDAFFLPDLITREDLSHPTDYDGGLSARVVAERLARGWLKHPSTTPDGNDTQRRSSRSLRQWVGS